ncbi:MAG: InlB B-repeat-containing protein, partial [Methanomassiliicoccaceae archaeon]|nr:InlB B-repeat-containing protein [Methanomassiliicoccaceae archaeon]
ALVTFNSNGGTSVTDVYVLKDGKIISQVTTKAANQFAGWYSDALLTTAFDFETTITENKTLYAKWDPLYNVTYNLNEGTGELPVQTPKIEGATFTASAITDITAPEGLVFKHWNTKIDGTGTSYASGATVTMPSNAITLYAIWVEPSDDGIDTIVVVAAVAVVAVGGLAAAGYFIFLRKP